MSSFKDYTNKLLNRTSLKGSIVSINDLQERDFVGEGLSDIERKALFRYEKYRILELNKNLNEESFNQKYMLLQVMANMRDYTEFLDDKYEYLDYTSL